MKYIKKRLNQSDKMQHSFLFQMCGIPRAERIPGLRVTITVNLRLRRLRRKLQQFDTTLSAIDMTAKETCERLILVSRPRQFLPLVAMLNVPTTPPFKMQIFLNFPVFSFKVFPEEGASKICQHYSCGNLAHSRYPSCALGLFVYLQRRRSTRVVVTFPKNCYVCVAAKRQQKKMLHLLNTTMNKTWKNNNIMTLQINK